MIEKLTWNQIRDEVKIVNPELTNLIDEFDPNEDYTIYKVKYSWGQHLLEKGMLYLPNSENKLVRIDDSSLDPKITSDLFYNSNMPVGMVLKNSAELYINVLDRIVPWVFLKEASLFGLWIGLEGENHPSNHHAKSSNIVAGSRSTLFLPKISDIGSFKRLKKTFNLQCDPPTNLTDQWPLMYQLSLHSDFGQKWQTEVIYFSSKWLECINNIHWKLFRNYLLEIAWRGTNYLRNQVIFDIIFSCALAEKNLKPNPFLSDTVKHIFAISQAGYPGYEIAIDNSIVPLDSFQQIFTNIYDLKYKPTMLVPGYMSQKIKKSLYYSLEIPTLMNFSPKARQMANKLDDLREIKHIIERVQDYIRVDFSKKQISSKSVPLYLLANAINFNFYHTTPDVHNEIRQASEIQQNDEHMHIENGKCQNKLFCDTSPFLRGCISMSHI